MTCDGDTLYCINIIIGNRNTVIRKALLPKMGDFQLEGHQNDSGSQCSQCFNIKDPYCNASSSSL